MSRGPGQASSGAELRRRAKAIFGDAAELSGPERARFLADACGSDAALRRAVDDLLTAFGEAGAFLSDPTHAHATHSTDGRRGAAPPPGLARVDEGPGSRIGPYRLDRIVGEGGFGVVYLAEQEEPLRRDVALKIIKLGMDTRRVIARFEAERQTLALMDHPDIARVYDAGATASGRPYFVMEFVAGEPITDYCRRRKLTIPERLDLFERVCMAVQHAHQKGIIHRDLKPNNVLVTHVDGAPRPKVIDFGIAKVTQDRMEQRLARPGQPDGHHPGGRRQLTDHQLTEERQLIGTPAYMAPEQATLGGDVDTRADVYSLGVLLYELIVGQPPFDHDALRAASIDEFRRILQEDDPPRPSSRLIAMGDDEHAVAEERRTEVWRMRRTVQGDLDWIIMKALEKDRSRRYPTANALAVDLRRYRADEPVEAGPPGAIYRTLKLVRRHRTATAMLAFATITLIAATAVSMAFATTAMQARNDAIRLQKDAESLARATTVLRDEAVRRGYNAAMRAAASAIELNDGDGARRQLDAAPPDLRGWEWHYIDARLRGAVATIDGDELRPESHDLAPDGSSVVTVWGDGSMRLLALPSGAERWAAPAAGLARAAFAPDGEHIVGSGSNGALELFDARRGVPLRSFQPHIGRVTALDFAPDGVHFVTAGEDGRICIRRIDAREPLRVLELDAPAGHAVWSPAHDRIATSGWDQRVRIWDPYTGAELAAFTIARPQTPLVAPARWPPAGVRAIAFSPDGSTLATAADDGAIGLWDVATATRRADLSDRLGHEVVRDLDFSPDGRRLAAASRTGSIGIWDARSGAHLLTIAAHRDDARRVCFMPDSSTILSCSWDHSVAVHDAATGERTHLFIGHNALVYDADPSIDGRHVVSRSQDHTLRIWALDRVGRSTLHRHHHWLFDVAFLARDRIATAPVQYPPQLIDVRSGQVLATLDAVPTTAGAVAYDAVHDRIAFGSQDGLVRVVDAHGELIRTLRGHRDRVATVSFSPGGELLASGSRDRSIRIWAVPHSDGADGTLVSEGEPPVAVLEGHGAEISGLAWDPDRSQLHSSAWDGSVRAWSVPDGAAVRTITMDADTVDDLAFDPVHGRLAVASNRHVHIIDADLGTIERTLLGHSRRVTDVAWLPDASRVVSVAEDRTVRLWDPSTGDEVLTLSGHENLVRGVTVSPDGTTIASCGEDGLVRLWRADPRDD